jgi:pSer/pThr/pTyr-binding forkhead associated (FHA) protein
MNVRLRRIFGGKLDDEVAVLCWPFLIGRAGDCHLKPDCSMVSRHHCELIVSGDRLVVRDLASRNGTFVNNDRVWTERDLTTGDKLTIGLCLLEVVIEPSVPSLCESLETGADVPEGVNQEAFNPPSAVRGCLSV